MYETQLTDKQTEIMTVVLESHVFGEKIDLDQLIEKMSYSPKKQSFQFSVRALVNRGFIEKGELEKRRGRKRRIIKPSKIAIDFLLNKVIQVTTPKQDEETNEILEKLKVGESQ